MFDYERLKQFIAQNGIDWSELIHAIDLSVGRNSQTPITIWDYPRLACQAVSGESRDIAEMAVLAVYCSTLSIRLVDDILDEDPKGQQHRWGVGRTANLALAFQALGSLLIEDMDLPSPVKARIQSLHLMGSIGTSYGQDLDALGVKDEDDYWRMVEAKTPPLIASAFEIGAILGGADDALIKQMAEFGHEYAMNVQITDDFADALETPAKDDWKRPLNNLAIHYAMTVEHEERGAFRDLVPCVEEDPDALAKAQAILSRSGAVSFCTWNMIERFRKLTSLFHAMKLKDEQPIRDLLHTAAAAPQSLLEAGGASPQEARAMLLASA